MLVAVVPAGPDPGDQGGAGARRAAARLRRLRADGRPDGPAWSVPDLATAVREIEAAERPRWLWAHTVDCYPRLVRAGVRVERCHDIELTEALLLGHEGEWGQPRSLAAAWARLTGAPVPADPPARAVAPPGDTQGTLFEAEPAPPATMGADPLQAIIEVYGAQLSRIDATALPGRFRLLVAAESAGALVAVEMGIEGLPWRPDVHDALLVELLGPPVPGGGPPRKVAELTARISAAFGGARIHPESPADVLRAFSREGISLSSTRAWELRRIEHPAVPLLLEFKELYRIWTAHGWSWLRQWVTDGRFRPEYVPGGVVSGRWATRGGGALQVPKVVRRAVVADEGWRLVVADAGQLEPRILAAVSGDAGMARAAGSGDMYAALAAEAFNGDRAIAKVALLGAMYGQTGGQAAPALATLRRSYPVALSYVEDAARTGETGGLVRSWLGRTCPPTGSLSTVDEEGESTGIGARARARGRFTRNFVIQATAAEWALALLAFLRTDLAGSEARLVFFVHDEVVVHCPAGIAPDVATAVEAAGERVRRLLFGDTAVRFPISASIVDCYADAK